MQACFSKKTPFLAFLLPAFFLVLSPLPGQGRKKKAGKEDLFTQWVREKAPHFLAPLPELGARVKEEELAKKILPLVRKIAAGENKALAAEALLTHAAAEPMESLPRLIEGMTQGRDSLTRRAAILAAGLSGEPGAAGPLVGLISPLKKDGPEKHLASISLGLLRGGQGKGPLLQTFQRMLSRSQQSHAQALLGFLTGLSLCATPGDANPLVLNLDQDKFADPSIRGAAAWLAARLDFPAVSKILFRLLRRKRDQARPLYLAALAFAPPPREEGLAGTLPGCFPPQGKGCRHGTPGPGRSGIPGGEGCRPLSLQAGPAGQGALGPPRDRGPRAGQGGRSRLPGGDQGRPPQVPGS